jgi:hypothetical protein
MQTKHEEIISNTSSLEEMKGKYLATRLLRSWKEDFVDEDNGEVVQIERHELLFEKGTLIDEKVLSEINFYLQSGAFTEVSISNQQRQGTAVKGYGSVFTVTIQEYKKKRTFYLYANSAELALEIAADYIEQTVSSSFVFASVKEIGYSNLIPDSEDDDEEENVENNYYKMEIETQYEEDQPFESAYIIKALDAEKAKELIYKFIALKMEEQKKVVPFEITIISAKKVGCSNIIHYDFSKKYMEESKEKPVEEKQT